ncbi:MAG TPA: sulfatase, partial [Planctomycetaceae bacterium]|nr:sulfatase [Planctomycetaceae bacterium]
YLGETAAFDAAVGVILKQLEEKGLAENTLVVISGDHGAPGFPYGKCNLYDFGTNVALIAKWPGHIPENRVVTDFTTLMDLAPTFLEAGQVDVPEVMTGKSLLPVMTSTESGRIDPTRNQAVTGRERHVAKARQGNLPYPQRAIRTDDYLYIINFAANRWPMGDPGQVDSETLPTTDQLTNETFVAFSDMDASPTKAWIIEHRNEPHVKPYYDYAFARRPGEELYILKDDPDQIHNVAGQVQYADIQKQLHQQLLSVLESTNDPRVVDDGRTFENPPFAGE